MNINELVNNGSLILSFQIEDEFEGFDENTLFEFTNGQYWLQISYSYHYHYAYRPSGKLYQFGGRIYLTIDGLAEYVQVIQVKAKEYTIVSDFRGWKGDTIFKMDNGEEWQQDQYDYDYNYSYRPKALIYNNGIDHIMVVERKSIKVKRIK